MICLFFATTINHDVRFTFDPNKDAANIEKHGLSLADAQLVFNVPDKLTLESPRTDDLRLVDMALAELAGVVLVYVMRHPDTVQAISLRRASKQERTLHADWQETH